LKIVPAAVADGHTRISPSVVRRTFEIYQGAFTDQFGSGELGRHPTLILNGLLHKLYAGLPAWNKGASIVIHDDFPSKIAKCNTSTKGFDTQEILIYRMINRLIMR
jgi:hypothetical protein